MPRAPGKPKPAAASSLAALGKALGVAPQSVHGWTLRGDWPFPRKAPWRIDDVRRWRAATLEPARNMGDALAPSPEVQRAKLAYVLERTLRERQRREIEAGKYVLRDEVERRFIGMIIAIRDAMQAMLRSSAVELAATFQGADAERVAALLDHRLTETFTDIGGGQVEIACDSAQPVAVVPACAAAGAETTQESPQRAKRPQRKRGDPPTVAAPKP